MDCSKLATSVIGAICNEGASAGAEDELFLFNFSNIDKVNSKVDDNVVKEISLKENSDYGYSFTTYGKSLNDSGTTFTLGTYKNSWIHNLALRIFVKNEDVKKFVNKFGQGAKVIAILKNNESGKDGDVKYEVYGWDNGLILKESTNTIALADGVVYSLSVGSSDEAQEGSLPKSFFLGDIASTELALKSLTQP
jgi:hypothetical protein